MDPSGRGALPLLVAALDAEDAWSRYPPSPADEARPAACSYCSAGLQTGTRTYVLLALSMSVLDPCRHLWTSSASLTAFLQKAPPTASYLFVSYSANATAAAAWMRGQLTAAGAAALAPARLERKLRRMHFATVPVSKPSEQARVNQAATVLCIVRHPPPTELELRQTCRHAGGDA